MAGILNYVELDLAQEFVPPLRSESELLRRYPVD